MKRYWGTIDGYEGLLWEFEKGELFSDVVDSDIENDYTPFDVGWSIVMEYDEIESSVCSWEGFLSKYSSQGLASVCFASGSVFVWGEEPA